jgi:hypothetical protein
MTDLADILDTLAVGGEMFEGYPNSVLLRLQAPLLIGKAGAGSARYFNVWYAEGSPGGT